MKKNQSKIRTRSSGGGTGFAVMLTNNRLSLKDFGVCGKTKIELTLINNLRNILGPHHLERGECYSVCPHSFFKEPCIWTPNPKNGTTDIALCPDGDMTIQEKNLITV